jgi:hypothetical protein
VDKKKQQASKFKREVQKAAQNFQETVRAFLQQTK